MTDQPPNVLWICTDEQRFDTLGCYGNEFVETPRLDELASTGIQFERAYCQNPVCTPSRASFLTGRYPRTTRCRQNGQPLPRDETLLPHVFAENDYRTGFSGKLHVSPHYPDASIDEREPFRPCNHGYEVRNWSHNISPHPGNQYLQWLREQGKEYSTTPRPESDQIVDGMSPEYHQTTWCADRAVDFMEQYNDEPWFFSVNIFDPHPAFHAPEGYLDRYDLDEIPLPNLEDGELDDKPVFQRDKYLGNHNRDDYIYTDLDDADHRAIRAAYWAMCDLIDEAVGEMLDALERTGQREETIIVFTSDHGEMLGDHGLYKKGPYFYEPAVRVPLLLDAPTISGGDSVSDIVELVDLAPTLLDMAEIDRPAGLQGESLRPLFDSGNSERQKSSAYCEFYNSNTHHVDPKGYATMLRTDRYKFVAVHGRDEGELYDLADDPTETENRWNDPDYREVKTRLFSELADRMARTVDPLPERAGPW